MSVSLPLCWFNRHRPQRQQVNWDGTEYVSSCRDCGKAIRRRAHRTWLADWREPRTPDS